MGLFNRQKQPPMDGRVVMDPTSMEISRRNAKISEEQAKLSSMYSQLGEAYYAYVNESGDVNAQFVDMLNSITDSINAIEQCKKEIESLQSVNKCSKCGAPMEANAQFCFNCGTSAIADDSQKICGSCGARVPKDVAFCINCGIKLPVASTKTVDINVERTCPNCNAKIEGNPKFCMGCGHPLMQDQSAPPQPESEPIDTPENQMEPQPEPEPVPQPEPTPEPVVDFDPYGGDFEPAPAPVQASTCPLCGGEISSDDVFCAGCGAKVK